MRDEIKVSIEECPVTLISDITFAQTPYWFPFYNYKDLKMDILLPFRKPDINMRSPLLVWICGGAFKTMEKSAYIPWLTEFAKKGFIVASIEYRMSNCAQMPAQIIDAKSAIRYLRAHADMYGIDTEKVAVGGESAGGMLATLVAATNGNKKYDVGDFTEYKSDVKAVINYYGPTSFKPVSDSDTESEFDAMSRVTKDMPPVFMAHGTKDELVNINMSEEMYKKLTSEGVDTEFYVVQDAGHMGMEFYQKEMTERVLQFLNKVL
ncbi:MAG: alpha/beta hydrolase [Butyrivibrio sp.]|nr:alpha/beta hydrolase [Butyrivibrio sp.]